MKVKSLKTTTRQLLFASRDQVKSSPAITELRHRLCHLSFGFLWLSGKSRDNNQSMFLSARLMQKILSGYQKVPLSISMGRNGQPPFTTCSHLTGTSEFTIT